MIGDAVDRGVNSIRLTHRMMQRVSMHQIPRDQQGSVDVEQVGIRFHPAKTVQRDSLILGSCHRRYRRENINSPASTDHDALDFPRMARRFVTVNHHAT